MSHEPTEKMSVPESVVATVHDKPSLVMAIAGASLYGVIWLGFGSTMVFMQGHVLSGLGLATMALLGAYALVLYVIRVFK